MYPLVIVLGIAAYRQKTDIVPYVLPLILIGEGYRHTISSSKNFRTI